MGKRKQTASTHEAASLNLPLVMTGQSSDSPAAASSVAQSSEDKASTPPESPRVSELISQHSIFISDAQDKGLEHLFNEYSKIKHSLKSKDQKNITKATYSLLILIKQLENHPKKKLINSHLKNCWYLRAACLFYVEVSANPGSISRRQEAYNCIRKAIELGFDDSKHASPTLFDFLAKSYEWRDAGLAHTRRLKRIADLTEERRDLYDEDIRKSACVTSFIKSYSHNRTIIQRYLAEIFPEQAQTILEHALELKPKSQTPGYISPRF
ncbi:hypothetical protein BN59_02156 [Legionella massiliensis]|uniref:Uncharacterized protein n=1 Tax=Legionella massiliensis TaxID=1034943 RepID=A0A078L1C6_9GAMM|nr:hypothetical protein [Legionella massiliensis]CDZ77863.1 hypothetical protein BN59_02156 [Legionella massiliensis]CEE13601.1 hypothetical protein BN1094_02156 [Legionella massiliensis]